MAPTLAVLGLFNNGTTKIIRRKIYDSKFKKVEIEKFKCVSCGHILSSIKANNFLSHAKEHYKRCHPDEIEEAKTNEQAKQLTISDSFEVLPNADRNIQQVAIAFAKTTLPINVFRSDKTRDLVNAVIKLRRVPNYKTIEESIFNLARSRLERIKKADFHGVQLSVTTTYVYAIEATHCN